MSPSRVPTLIAALLLGLLPETGRAADWYVDAIAGSNANSGSSPAAAWKTVSFAISALPAGSHVLHVAPGIYDAALGESWPALMPPDVILQGDGGSAVTVLDAAGAPGALRFESSAAHAVNYKQGKSRVQGFTIHAGQYGVELHSSAFETSPRLVDLVVTGASVAGVRILRDGGTVDAWVESCALTGNAVGLRYDIGLGFNGVLGGLYLLGCTVSGNAGDGISFVTDDGSLTLLINRTRVEGNGGHGVHLHGINGPVTSTIENSSFSGNAGSGIAQDDTGGGNFHMNMRTCTVAHNGGAGIHTYNPYIQSSILWGNLLDLDGSGTPSGCDIGTGVFLPGSNFTADPQFVDVAGLDFHIPPTSPCIDHGTSQTGGVDLDGNTRVVDGDLDTLRTVDVGAFEWQSLHLAGAPVLGTTPELEIYGESGASCTLLLSGAPPVAGKTSKWGQFQISPAMPFWMLAPVPAAPGPLATLPLPIPDDVGLLGAIVTFQGLTTSSAAPHGAAFTNPVSFTLQ